MIFLSLCFFGFVFKFLTLEQASCVKERKSSCGLSDSVMSGMTRFKSLDGGYGIVINMIIIIVIR